jgi:glycosyltransferase involved in cell wall biosynthesis
MSQKKPLVTIVTITFNLIKAGRKEYFRQCIESVHNQSYKNIEHIVIDGASNDGTLDLIKEYADKGWIKYTSKPDTGLYNALNKGIKAAKGKYIAFLHSDDFYHNKDAVLLSVNALEKESADYSFADTRGIDHRTEKLIHLWRGNINQIPFGTQYCHQSMFVKTDVIKELGGFDTAYKISADSDLMIKLVAQEKKYIYIPESIVSYRGGGISNKLIRETRKEHSEIFYKHIGRKMGLTREECFLVWNFSIFKERGLITCLGVGRKLKKAGWKKEYYNKMFSFGFLKQQIKQLLPKSLSGRISDIIYFRSKK